MRKSSEPSLSLDDRIDRIIEGMARLSASAPDMPVYQLHPVASEDEVAAFESAHSVALPAEYRAFLLRAGNGGGGPTGLFPLGLTCERVDYRGEPQFFGDLSKKFPLRARWNGVKYRSVPLDGSIHIATHGCALYDLLVLTGPGAGNVWYDARADGLGLWPLAPPDDIKPLTFLSYYELWLRERLACLAPDGTRIPSAKPRWFRCGYWPDD